jgi:hypothetical protein
MSVGRNVILFLLTVCAPGAATPAAAAADAPPASRPAEPPPSKTAERQILVQGVRRMDVKQLLFERALSDPKPRAVLGIEAIDARKVTVLRDDVSDDQKPFDPISLSGPREERANASYFRVRVDLSSLPDTVPPKAEQFLDAVLKQFREELRAAWENEPLLQHRREYVERAQREADENRVMIQTLRRDIGNATGRAVSGSSAETRAAWSALEQERQALDLELVGKRARQEALVKAIKEVSSDQSAKATKDPVAEELEKVVAARLSALENAKQLQKAAAVSQQEVVEAEGKVAEARARVLERRDLVADRTGGTILVDLNKELQSVIISVAEA